MNRSKNIHFQEKIDINLLEFNRVIGGLIAEEFLEFRKI